MDAQTALSGFPCAASIDGHAWEPTGITFSVSGRKWSQVKEVDYCPNCRRFAGRTTMFLDGRMFKTDADAAKANQAEWDRSVADRGAWLAEHHPEHVAGG